MVLGAVKLHSGSGLDPNVGYLLVQLGSTNYHDIKSRYIFKLIGLFLTNGTY